MKCSDILSILNDHRYKRVRMRFWDKIIDRANFQTLIFRKLSTHHISPFLIISVENLWKIVSPAGKVENSIFLAWILHVSNFNFKVMRKTLFTGTFYWAHFYELKGSVLYQNVLFAKSIVFSWNAINYLPISASLSWSLCALTWARNISKNI